MPSLLYVGNCYTCHDLTKEQNDSVVKFPVSVDLNVVMGFHVKYKFCFC